MIAVDASAILAILLDEPEGPGFSQALAEAGGAKMSPVNFWESLVRMEAIRGTRGRDEVDRLLHSLDIQIEPVTAKQARAAADAFQRFGKKSPARLNLGDCFAYALALEEGDGLLYKGDDFAKTDVTEVG